MDKSANVKALSAAFSFGFVVNGASVALYFYIKGHGSSFKRDGPRLALVSFLATAAIWAQIAFVATLINTNSTVGCQTAIIFASAFDQLARLSLFQGLSWKINSGIEPASIEVLISQALIFVRFVLGAVFVAFQRPQTDIVCVTKTQLLPLGIAVVIVDVLLVAGLLAKAILVGLHKDVGASAPRVGNGRAVVFAICGLGIWIASSAPMLLGLESIDLTARTVIPATALAILLSILTFFKDGITQPRATQSANYIEPSDSYDLDASRNLHNRNISSADSVYPPSRYEEVKAATLTAAQRELSRQDTMRELKGGLPLITRPSAGQAKVGMGGVPVKGQLFPPMNGLSAPPPPGTRRNRPQAPWTLVKDGGKLVISKPILRDSNEQNPLRRMDTIDLETAARQETERRAIAHIPELLAPQSMGISSRSFGPVQEPIRPAHELAAFAMTTSTQLSPGVEEIRRRSPGQAPQKFSQKTPPATPQHDGEAPVPSSSPPKRPARTPSLGLSGVSPVAQPKTMSSTISLKSDKEQHSKVRKPSPPPVPSSDVLQSESTTPSARKSLPTPSMASISSTKKAPLPRSNSVKSSIRPSRQLPPSPPKVPSKTGSTPVHSRVKSGLPSNPRARAIKVLEQEQGPNQRQTVMFMNGIRYHDPGAIEGILGEASEKKSEQAAGFSLARVASVVHRPRPIPRKPEVDRAIFPAEDSPNLHEHRRSLSGNSLRNKRPSFKSLTGETNQLPALPPAPKSAGNPLRPHPNNTKSMTWNEKMQLFYPATASTESGTTKTARRRSSSVPELPMLPEVYLKASAWNKDSSSQDLAQPSARVTNTLVTPNVLSDRVTSIRIQEIRNISKFSMTTYQSTPYETSSHFSSEGSKRRSSPVLPAEGLSPSLTMDGRSQDDDETATNWGSVHSPAQPINLQRCRVVEVPAVPKLFQPPVNQARVDEKTLSVMSNEDGRETMTVMLDPTIKQDLRSAQKLQESKSSPAPEAEVGSWHRRVGEPCPTFTERRQKGKLRKGTPPAPLLMDRINKMPLVIQTEPSPLESPGRALETIEAQLKKLEEPHLESTGGEEQQRMTLLANLESEMGQQENHWQQMRHTLVARDSISTMDISPSVDPSCGSLRNSTIVSERSLRDALAERRASRHQHPRSRASGDMPSASTEASGLDHSIDWQQKLAEAQREFIGNRPDLLARSSIGLNFLAVSHASLQLGSPSPPESDDSGSEHDEVTVPDQMTVKTGSNVVGLWQPLDAATVTKPFQAHLWMPPVTQQLHQLTPVEEPERLTRSRPRKDLEPLRIDSSKLWEKPIVKRRFSIGLWRKAGPSRISDPSPETAKVVSKPSRPVTQKPPRRSRRVTLLPDILESPKPLPEKRGTLGIYQFPWGDVSDTATVQPRAQVYTAMSGTMASGGSINRAALGAQTPESVSSNESSQSFFDDYEEEDEGDMLDDDYDAYGSDYADDDYDDAAGVEEDDGFDETTLWEIASLLKSNEVPSHESLFLNVHDSIDNRGQVTDQDAPRLPKHQKEQSHGDTDTPKIGHGDKSVKPAGPVAVNAASPALPTDDAGVNASEWQCDSVPEDDESEAASQSIVQTGNATKMPVAVPSAALWSNDDGAPQQQQVEVTPPMQKRQAPGTLPQPDAQSWSAYLALAQASATDGGVRAPEIKAELLVEDDESQMAISQGTQRLWTISAAVRIDNPRLWGNKVGGQRSAVGISSLWTPTPAGPPQPAIGFGQADDQDSIIHLAPTPDLVSIQNPRGTAANVSFASSSSAPLVQQLHSNRLGNSNTKISSSGNSMALWTPTTPAAISSSKGLPQPDHTIWNSYLPSLEHAARIVPRKSVSATIESTSLWSPAKKTRVEGGLPAGLWGTAQMQPSSSTPALPGMWSPSATIEKVSHGLSQPGEQVWEAYLPAPEDDVRVKPRNVTPASIESRDLWTPPPQTLIAPSTESLWTAPNLITARSNYGMWTPVAVVEHEESNGGLFSVSHVRSDFRSSNLEPAALEVSRKPRPAAEPFATLAFAYLWNESPLWRGPKKVVEEQAEGMFNTSHRRSSFRTSSEEPAALGMMRKPRVSADPLPQLTTNNLWSLAAAKPVSQDWLAVSTGRVSLSTASTLLGDSAEEEEAVTASLWRIEATAAQWKEALNEAIQASKATIAAETSQSALWAKPAQPPIPTEPTIPSKAETASMWQPSTEYTTEPEPKYTISEPDSARSTTLRNRRKSDDEDDEAPLSYSNFLRLTSPATPRDFSAQALWTPGEEDVMLGPEERTWLDESVYRLSSVSPLS